MKLNRLMGMVTLLLNRERVTAPQLAQRFEVSRRTINRDIESLCQAGIPVVTLQGRGGGISLAEGYTLQRSVLTRDELWAVLCGVRSVDSVLKSPLAPSLSEKMGGAAESGAVLIDLASHYYRPLSEMIDVARRAIEQHRTVRFCYYGPGGETEREAEPYRLVFRWSSWYLFGYCRLRGGFRLFKLQRIDDLQATDETFAPRPVDPEKLDYDRYFSGGTQYRLKAYFLPEVKHRVVEDYGPGGFVVCADGRLLVERDYASYEHMREWVLSFGAAAVVEQPAELAQEIKHTALQLLALYDKT